MSLSVEIDRHSGFCGGVIGAIGKAEEALEQNGKLYSLGAIVHNEAELERLAAKGLSTMQLGDMEAMGAGETVLIRAHGEPPSTYALASRMGLKLLDCTCPVVLRLQRRIREAYARVRKSSPEGQILIFGKVGHAEVLGLVGQTGNDALVIENMDMLGDALRSGKICMEGPIELFSQTTKSPDEYKAIASALRNAVKGPVTVHNTICSQVAARHSQLADFARTHDVVVFVSGRESSNGKVLFELCRTQNTRSHQIGSLEDLRKEWFRSTDHVGVCGATSTPKWLLDAVARKILRILE